MKILKKSIILFVLMVILFSMGGILQNESKAATYLIKEADLYSKGEMVSFRYKEIGIAVEFVVYKKDGVEYPAYCLNRDLIGVTTDGGAKVTVNKALENVAVWRAIINGYPFKTPAELKCNSAHEAFAATKMAVYDALYHYDWSDFDASNAQGERVLAAAEKISKIARSSQETKPVGKVTIQPIDEEWKADNIEDGYVSKKYKVVTNVDSTEYTIKLEGTSIQGAKILDENNKEQSKFKAGEQFKVLIPTSEIEYKFNINNRFQLRATANLKTKPVLYGETANSAFQDYALAAGEWEFEEGTFLDQFPANKTKIKIVKQDAETGKQLANAKFHVLDKDKNIIFADVITNEEGIAEILNVIPGHYYIQEVESPDGYTKYDEMIEIEVGFNETYTVNVGNYEKPKEEQKETEYYNEISVTGKKEKALPRTGF